MNEQTREATIELIQMALMEDSAVRSEAECVYDLFARYPQSNFEADLETQTVEAIAKALEVQDGDRERAERVIDALDELGLLKEPQNESLAPGF